MKYIKGFFRRSWRMMTGAAKADCRAMARFLLFYGLLCGGLCGLLGFVAGHFFAH